MTIKSFGDGRGAMLREAISSNLPSSPNCSRLDFTGGTQNATGELEGQAVTKTPFAAFPARPSDRLQDAPRPNQVTRRRGLLMLEQYIDEGDLLEYKGRRWRCVECTELVEGENAGWKATIEDTEQDDRTAE